MDLFTPPLRAIGDNLNEHFVLDVPPRTKNDFPPKMSLLDTPNKTRDGNAGSVVAKRTLRNGTHAQTLDLTGKRQCGFASSSSAFLVSVASKQSVPNDEGIQFPQKKSSLTRKSAYEVNSREHHHKGATFAYDALCAGVDRSIGQPSSAGMVLSENQQERTLSPPITPPKTRCFCWSHMPHGPVRKTVFAERQHRRSLDLDLDSHDSHTSRWRDRFRRASMESLPPDGNLLN